jgi:hypothetical protein
MIAFIFPSLTPLPRRQHFRETFFRCPFHFKSAPRNRPPPQLFDASYTPALIYTIYFLHNKTIS